MTLTAAFSIPVARTAAALVLALAGASALAQAQPAAPGPMRAHAGAGMHQGMHHGMGAGMGGEMAGAPMLPERMLAAAGASAEQKAQVRKILDAAREDLRQQREGQRELHQQMMALMTAPQLDAAAAEALRQKLQAGHDAASKRMLQAMLDASAVLTPEQRQKLAERMKQRREMMERHQRERRALEPRG